jgi:hypothetical protein
VYGRSTAIEQLDGTDASVGVGVGVGACQNFCGKRRDKPVWRRRWKSSTSKG